ncbi:serine/threonine-protein kinase [Streptomyces sp. NBC_01537]|uniref:serine/threonine-protein kinase n=1 Tax=Streptomyces sp. NBC_01537 TaxID=2903896 RepID=UPI003868369E
MQPLESADPERFGPYHLIARLGAGGMGQVFLARSGGGRTVAIKAIRPELAGSENFRRRFRREVEAASAVGGRYTAPVLDAAPDDPTPWLATAYVVGPTLADAVSAHGPLPMESVLALGAGLAEALVAVHSAGLVHRDLKPSNVMLAADGPRVIDFGIVRAADDYELTRSGILLGSPRYMCPEQATGDPMGPEGDVFCLGSVLAFAATGRAPFSGSSAATLLYQVAHGTEDLTAVPAPLDKIIGICLAKEPRARPTPDRISAMCAPAGTDQALHEGWLPAAVSSSIALHAAAVMDLDAPLREPAVTEVPGPADGSGVPRERPRSHRSRPSRRTVLIGAAAGGVAVLGGGGALLLSHSTGSSSALRPLGRAPEPNWTYSGRTLLPVPAVFNDGTALLKALPGSLLCLSLKDGSRPKWVYDGISQSPTPPLLVFDAVAALGSGAAATVVGVDPATGAERFAQDYGTGFRFDTVLGKFGDDTVIIVGLRFESTSDGKTTAETSRNVIVGTDLRLRRALITPISVEDIGIALKPIIVPGFFVYTDGLRNITARSAEDSSVLWQHPVGYDVRPELVLLGKTVLAAGGQLIALALDTGRVRWQVRASTGGFGALGVLGNTVYATSADGSGVYAFDAANGSRRWFCRTPPLDIDLPITASAGTVFVPAFENKDGFYAISADRGELLWNFTDGQETGVNGWQLACDSKGHLIATHFDRVYCLTVS